MATRMQQRRGTAAQWAAANPVLAPGEMGVETDTGVFKFGNGATNWNQLPVALAGSFLPTNGKAYDSERLDGLDSSAFLQANYVDDRILPAGANRQLVIHFGNVTVFPATGFRVGDRCFRTDLFCEFYYTGTAWRQTNRAQMTSAQRAALSAGSKSSMYVGFEIYETDTLLSRRWDGTYWEITNWHGPRSGVTGSGTTGLTSSPAMSLRWANAVISNAVAVTFSGWTSVYSPGPTYANAGEGAGGPSLFTYLNTPGQSIRCNAKGRVQVDLFLSSDAASAGQSNGAIVFNGGTGDPALNDGLIGGPGTVIQRAGGYPGAGSIEQWMNRVFYVNPGDTFGCRVYQATATGISVTYQAYLQAKYI